MSVTSALTAGRRAAAARMLSRCSVLRRTGETIPDETTGADVPEWDTVAVEVPFRLGGANSGSPGSRTLDVDGGEVTVAVRTAHFPHDFDELRDGDLIDVTAGDCVGLVLRVVEATFQDQATARRVLVVEERRPEEWA